MVGGVVLATSGLAVVFRYVYESSPDYPYRKVVEIRSWFHFYNLDNESWFGAKLGKEAMGKAQKLTKAQLLSYADGWLNWASPSSFDLQFLAEDLEQVFVLYVLQRYKRIFARRLGIMVLAGAALFFVFLTCQVVTLVMPALSGTLWGLCLGGTVGGILGTFLQY